MKTPALLLATAGLLAACSQPLPTANNTTAVEVNGTEDVMPSEGEPMPEDNTAVGNLIAETPDFTGKWIGVEGTYLNVAAKPGGGVTLDMQWGLDADMKGKFDGTVTPAGITFTRGGVAEVLKPTDGDATGLKWLAGKTDCLTVKSGEGYCRG